MRALILFSLILSLVACRQLKTLDRSIEVRENVTRVIDSVTIIIRDTTIIHEPAPEPTSRVTLDDSSYLETSLAWSLAVAREGILFHRLENKPEMPLRVPLKTSERVRVERDTTVIRHVIERETVKERYRLFNPFFYASGWGGWITLIIAVAWKITRHRKSTT
jgi:hypothetical protein